MRGGHRMQCLAQVDQRLMQVTVDLGMHDFGRLLLHGLDHLRVCMAGIGYANATGKIQVAFARCGIDITTFTALNHQIGRATPNGG